MAGKRRQRQAGRLAHDDRAFGGLLTRGGHLELRAADLREILRQRVGGSLFLVAGFGEFTL